MIEINRRRVANPRVEYHQADLFEWTPREQYDLVFFAFWLSHVPPDLADAFLSKVRDAVSPGGHLFIIDQCSPPDDPPRKLEGVFERRASPDGRTFMIVKVFYHPGLLAARVEQLGFEATAERVDHLFYLSGTRLAA